MLCISCALRGFYDYKFNREAVGIGLLDSLFLKVL